MIVRALQRRADPRVRRRPAIALLLGRGRRRSRRADARGLTRSRRRGLQRRQRRERSRSSSSPSASEKMCESKSEIEFVPYEKVYGSSFEDMRRRVPDLAKINRRRRLPAAGLARSAAGVHDQRHVRADGTRRSRSGSPPRSRTAVDGDATPLKMARRSLFRRRWRCPCRSRRSAFDWRGRPATSTIPKLVSSTPPRPPLLGGGRVRLCCPRSRLRCCGSATWPPRRTPRTCSAARSSR